MAHAPCLCPCALRWDPGGNAAPNLSRPIDQIRKVNML